MKTHKQVLRHARGEQGMTMIELMVALTVLAIGVLALMGLITAAIRSNNRSKTDSSGTMAAQMVIETISAQSSPSQAITITDCNGTAWTISGQDAASPGAGASLNASNAIDFLGQTYAAVPANYKMQYRECGQGGRQVTYDVRWNIQTLTAFSRMVTVSARPLGGSSNSPQMFQVPVTLRTIAVQGN